VPALLRIRGYRFFSYSLEGREPPQDVCHALTGSAALADWLMKNDFIPRHGHRFHLRFKSRLGFERKIARAVLEGDEPRLLYYTWGGPGSEVTFRLEAMEGGTRLRLEHTGFRGARGFAFGRALRNGWKHKIEERLPALLAGIAAERRANK
jgi:uncharacterized protein YndB with AHSA1/START domain